MDYKKADQQYILNTYKRADVLLDHGKSATVYDDNNKEYIDFTSGIGVNSLGFCDDTWVKAVSKQAGKLQHTSNLYYTKPCIELAKMLCEKTSYKKAFFSNSGAEANEGAIKIARKYSFDKYGADSNRFKILTLVNSFHGRTITTLKATGQDVFHNYFFPFTEGFEYGDINNFDEIAKTLEQGDFCAVMIEFVQGEGGVISLDKEFIAKLQNLTQEKDILFIADEVQTGIGRTGKLLASEHFGFTPDITTLAKGLGGGLPIGAILCNEKTENVLKFSDHGTTYGGNPVVCAGAKVVLENLDIEEIAKKGEYIREKLSKFDAIEEISGLGMMIGIKLKDKDVPTVISECLSNGLIVLSAKNKLRFLPPLTISQDEIDSGLNILSKVLSKDTGSL